MPASRSGRSNAKRHSDDTTSSRSRFKGVDEIDKDKQTDDEGDDDDDEEDEDEGDGADDDLYNAETFLHPDWQVGMGTNGVTAQGLDKNIHAIAQSSFRFPPRSETQPTFNRPSSSAHWGEDARITPMSSTTYHPNPNRTGYQPNGLHIFSPSTMGVNFGIEPNFTASPDLYPFSHTEQSIISQNMISADYSTPKEAQDTFMGGMSRVQHKGAVDQSTHNEMIAQPSQHNSIDDCSTQQELTAIKYQSSVGNQALSASDLTQGNSQAPTMASPPVSSPPQPSPGSRALTLHHVSVDAECTSEELGDLVRNLVGVTKRIVVRVDD